jgi:hypothetical protein
MDLTDEPWEVLKPMIPAPLRRANGRGRPWRPHRIIAHVKLCVLALRLERAAEIRCQHTWRTIRQTLDQLKVVRYRLQGKTIVQSTQVTSPMAEILQQPSSQHPLLWWGVNSTVFGKHHLDSHPELHGG